MSTVAPRPRDGVLTARLGDGLLVHDPRARRLHALNATAATIWEALDGRRSTAQVAATVAKRLGLDVATIAADVEAAVEGFRDAHLLAGGHLPSPRVPAPSPTPTSVHRTGDGEAALLVRALDRRVRLVGPPPVLIQLERPLAALVAGGAADPHDVELVIEPRPGGWTVLTDGYPDSEHADATSAAEHVLWLVNHGAVIDSGGHLLLHAGAVAGPGGAVAIAGSPDAGKSTLTATCVGRGMTYLTDEAARVEGGLVMPYPKPISLDDRAIELVASATGGDAVALRRAAVGERNRHVAPTALGAVATAAEPLRALVLPDRHRHERDLSPPLGATDAALAIAEVAFDLAGGGQVALDELVALAQRTSVVRLATGDLVWAADQVAALVGDGTT